MTASVLIPAVRRACAILLCLATIACAPMPQQPPIAPAPYSTPTLSVERTPSPNYDARRPNLVVLHHTSSPSAEHALATLTRRGSEVSSHYLVARDGKIHQLVDERDRAWHAGVSSWAGQRDLNSASIGIELDNNGREPYPEQQIVALLTLLADLKERYSLPSHTFVGHGDIAPGRKVDPNELFPWRRLAQSGFGVWCDPPYPAVPGGLDTALLLQAFGYSVWNLEAAVGAFKRRFVPEDPSAVMTEKDRSMLYCLVLQQQALGE